MLNFQKKVPIFLSIGNAEKKSCYTGTLPRLSRLVKVAPKYLDGGKDEQFISISKPVPNKERHMKLWFYNLYLAHKIQHATKLYCYALLQKPDLATKSGYRFYKFMLY